LSYTASFAASTARALELEGVLALMMTDGYRSDPPRGAADNIRVFLI
jgi:hypothetical protein